MPGRVKLIAGIFIAGLSVGTTETIRVDTKHVIRSLTGNPLGINLNYLRDDDANTPDPDAPRLRDVLKELNIKWLRYPGGEKSDHYRFSSPPYTNAAPVVKNTRNGQYTRAADGYDLLDFDEFIKIAHETEAEPVVVVAYDSEEFSETPLAEFIEHAAAWVRYANMQKGYDVRYWEIGNENWHPHSNNRLGKRSQDIRSIVEAMRAVDPSIKIGTSGADGTITGDALDFVTYSNYAGMPMDRYRTEIRPDLSVFKKTVPHQSNMPVDEKKVFAVEFNAVEFTPNANWNHDVTHCLELFDMIGQLLSDDRIDCAMLWGTRWIEERDSRFIWYLVDKNNALTPIGKVYSMWSTHLKPNLVHVESPDALRCFAMHDPKTKNLSVMIINRSEEEKSIKIKTGKLFTNAEQQTFSGTTPEDNQGQVEQQSFSLKNHAVFSLPPISANVITLN